ncbi:MAG: M24 family metallopeptidase [Patescibacteria group bacterium]|jgi:Xaa-Pro aminopeptidase
MHQYQHIQNISKQCLQHLRRFIQVGLSEIDIDHECKSFFKQHGVTKTWYHGKLALVFVGERNKLSMSGRDYQPTNIKVQEFDLVSVDFSPELEGYWSDYARSIVVANGKAVTENNSTYPDNVQEMFAGLAAQETLHKKLVEIFKPGLTFAEINQIMSEQINNLGYKNLDFKNNLGHTIEKHIDDRIYLEAKETRVIGENRLFTFEPHILRKQNGHYGIRKEDIYYFANGKLLVL